ncbi:probable nucleoporin Nup58 isoform X2 [Anoplophora glabripennis]|uniref:probable nucleoporin Nup58 isoform X2 n=1 Tax=Anoplophora glabripennis TaxID=217634 RepID=UPI0008745670|nr:probable nucleoporin Nup58 isoform X2 [Anoplophora glabripennis]
MSSGFGFGSKSTAVPSFGTGSITFGTPATTITQNQPGFGVATTNVQSTSGFQFGTPTTSASTPNLFGTPGSNFKPSGFGTLAQNVGLFNTSTPTAPTGLTFGTPTTSVVNVGLSLGGASTTVTPSTGLFGTPVTSTVTPLSFGLGTPATTATSLFPATTSGVGSNLFATPASTTTTPGFGFGLSSTTAPTLGKPPTTVVGGLTFGVGAPTSTGLNFGLGGATITSAATTNLNALSTASSLVGLGGQASSQIKTGTVVTTQKEVAPKEQPLPNEILQTVEQFKEMVKNQKLYSSDIARCSIRDFKKVEQEIDLLNNILNEVECQLQKNRYLAEKLKYDTAKSLQNVEMAQRTQDTPPGLQYENSAPLKFFLELGDQFEREMQALKTQIEAADKYVKNHRNPDTLTPQDLSLGMRRLHETFVALAGRLQSVHNQVESQKDTYINIRRHLYNDVSNPFDKISKSTDLIVGSIKTALIYSPPKVASGPTPFNHMPFLNGNPLVQQPNQSTYSATTSVAPSGTGPYFWRP